MTEYPKKTWAVYVGFRPVAWFETEQDAIQYLDILERHMYPRSHCFVMQED